MVGLGASIGLFFPIGGADDIDFNSDEFFDADGKDGDMEASETHREDAVEEELIWEWVLSHFVVEELPVPPPQTSLFMGCPWRMSPLTHRSTVISFLGWHICVISLMMTTHPWLHRLLGSSLSKALVQNGLSCHLLKRLWHHLPQPQHVFARPSAWRKSRTRATLWTPAKLPAVFAAGSLGILACGHPSLLHKPVVPPPVQGVVPTSQPEQDYGFLLDYPITLTQCIDWACCYARRDVKLMSESQLDIFHEIVTHCNSMVQADKALKAKALVVARVAGLERDWLEKEHRDMQDWELTKVREEEHQAAKALRVQKLTDAHRRQQES